MLLWWTVIPESQCSSGIDPLKLHLAFRGGNGVIWKPGLVLGCPTARTGTLPL